MKFGDDFLFFQLVACPGLELDDFSSLPGTAAQESRENRREKSTARNIIIARVHKITTYLCNADRNHCLVYKKAPGTVPWPNKSTFFVSRVIQPNLPSDLIGWVKFKAVFSKATRVSAWRELQDDAVWLEGWV